MAPCAESSGVPAARELRRAKERAVLKRLTALRGVRVPFRTTSASNSVHPNEQVVRQSQIVPHMRGATFEEPPQHPQHGLRTGLHAQRSLVHGK